MSEKFVGDVRKELLRLLKEAEEEITIITPWISEEYAEILEEKSRKGIKVRIHTTDDAEDPSHANSLRKLTKQAVKKEDESKPWIRDSGIAISILGMTIGAISFQNMIQPIPPSIQYILTLGLIAIGGLITYLGIEKRQGIWEPKVDELKIYKFDPNQSLNANIYIADNMMAIGSANLTNISLDNSYESLSIEEISEEEKNSILEDIQNSRLQKADINRVGDHVNSLELDKIVKQINTSI